MRAPTIRMRIMSWVLRWPVCFAALTAVSCTSMGVLVPTARLPISGPTGALYTCNGSLVRVEEGTVQKDARVAIWDWDDLGAPPRTMSVGPVAAAASLGKDRVLTVFPKSLPDDPNTWSLVLRRFPRGDVCRRWNIDYNWHYRGMRSSRNRNYAVVWLKSRFDLEPPSVRIGVVCPRSKSISWMADVPARLSGPTFRAMQVSENGQYVAAVGRYNGGWIQVLATKERKTLWERRAPGEAGLNDVGFSPDGSVVYAGGTMGYVFGFDTRSGRMVSKWAVKGLPRYPWRIYEMAVSANGRLVAAGVVPDGQVSVWDARRGVRVCHFTTGQGPITGLAFSPDPARLATAGADSSIRIWRMPTE